MIRVTIKRKVTFIIAVCVMITTLLGALLVYLAGAVVVVVPLNIFIRQLVIIAILMLFIIVLSGSVFGRVITDPIRKLHLATEHIMEGGWDYKIDLKTGDEIEQFAETFKAMMGNIKEKQIKLEDFSRDLEKKVRDRTKELSDAEEATLNILEDLEESKKKLEESNKELKAIDKLKSDFISIVSHELRTPLSIIKEGVIFVIDRVPGEINEKQQKILDISKFNIDRLTRIIDSLLDISKIEAGKVELKRSLINIANIVKEIAASFEMKIREKGLTLKLNIDNDAGCVYADPDRIAQVLINLISNAVKFTTSGYIEVSCNKKDNHVMCSVKDTGPGISKDDIPKLFNKFQQFGRLAGAGEKGTGLGLSIAKGIIDMHSGSIYAESEPGMGASFTFALHRYNEQTLFNEFIDKAIKRAAETKSKMSIIVVSYKDKSGSNDAVWLKAFNNAMNDCSRIIKDMLRRQGDELVSRGADMLVILPDCDKDHSVLVKNRLEQILNKSLEEKKIKEKIDTQYGCATFPEDGKTSIELLNKSDSACRIGRFTKA